jgi:hypothetical protein
MDVATNNLEFGAYMHIELVPSYFHRLPVTLKLGDNCIVF